MSKATKVGKALLKETIKVAPKAPVFPKIHNTKVFTPANMRNHTRRWQMNALMHPNLKKPSRKNREASFSHNNRHSGGRRRRTMRR